MGRKENEPTDPMQPLIEEQLTHLRDMHYKEAQLVGDFDLAEWVADGADFEPIDFADDLQREACAFAWGYIRGCAEMADLTASELLSEVGLRWNTAKPAKPLRRARRTRRAS